MSTTIKSISGRDLYIAQNAADVRAAVIEAAASGAYLSGANLNGAYLSGANLSRAYLSGANLNGAYLSGADLNGANLSGANLSRAYLSGANLNGANLSRADLNGANLSGANLSGANLSRAYLSGAEGFDPRRCNSLLMLLDQPGAIRAYKLVTDAYQSPMGYGPLTYAIGATLEAPDADTDATRDCGAGINIATLPWVMAEWHAPWRIVLVEFTAADIAAIPVGEGKFRVRRCTVIRELDLVELGLIPAPVAPETPAKAKRTRKAVAK